MHKKQNTPPDQSGLYPRKITNTQRRQFVQIVKPIIILAIFCLARRLELTCGETFITHKQCGGRFGHQLLVYMKAKAVSFLTKKPYLHQQFKHSDHLALDTEQALASRKFDRIISVKKIHDIKNYPGSTLYTVSLGTHVNPFKLPESYRDMMKQLVKPKEAITGIPIPPDSISIAIHVRMGDCRPGRTIWGVKCHEEKLYIELVRKFMPF